MIDVENAANNEEDNTSSAKKNHEENGSIHRKFFRKLTRFFLNGSIDCSNNRCRELPSRLRNDWQKSRAYRNLSLPQHAPLYAALFCSIVAITLSVHAHLSTRFVTLKEPIRVSPFFKNVEYIGLSTWQLCAIKQDTLDEINVAGEDGIEGDDGTATTAALTVIKRPIVASEDGIQGDGTAALTVTKRPISTTTRTTDVQRNVTSRVRTTYHAYIPPHSLKRSTTWMEEPDHDDVLVSGDFPYNDDDAFESDIPMDYWNCHYVKLNSKSVGDDKIWNTARVFFMMGSMTGFASIILLVTLIVLRGRGVKRRRGHWRGTQQELLQRQIQHQQSDETTLALQSPPEAPLTQHYQTLSVANNLLSLDTDSSGYRPISICFLLSYLESSLTLLFLDSQICRENVCSISTGAHSLLGACALWVVSGLLVLFMMKRVIRNEIRVRRFNKRRMPNREESAVENDLQTNHDHDAEEDVKQSLLPVTTSDDVSNAVESGKEDSLGDVNSALNTTSDTESSEFSSLASPEEA